MRDLDPTRLEPRIRNRCICSELLTLGTPH